MPMTIGTAVRTAGVGVSGMYAGLAGVTTQFAAKGANNAAASAQMWAQTAAKNPTMVNNVNASASQAITAALQGVATIGSFASKFFIGIANAFSGGK